MKDKSRKKRLLHFKTSSFGCRFHPVTVFPPCQSAVLPRASTHCTTYCLATGDAFLTPRAWQYHFLSMTSVL